MHRTFAFGALVLGCVAFCASTATSQIPCTDFCTEVNDQYVCSSGLTYSLSKTDCMACSFSQKTCVGPNMGGKCFQILGESLTYDVYNVPNNDVCGACGLKGVTHVNGYVPSGTIIDSGDRKRNRCGVPS